MTKKSTFHLSKMDCPTEEQMVRMKLEDFPEIKALEFDLEKRNVMVIHAAEEEKIKQALESLKLGTSLLETAEVDNDAGVSMQDVASDDRERKLLWTVLAINFGFFIIEITTGFISRSMGLVADSLDMLADSLVYGLSLWAVGSAVSRKKKVATMSGYFQMLLAFLGLVEVVRRFMGHEVVPDFRMMIIVSVLALIANSVALYILQKSKSKEAHMKASMIFTSNDVIINSGVILAGILVFLTNSKYPDLIIGALVFFVVVRGALRILKLGK